MTTPCLCHNPPKRPQQTDENPCKEMAYVRVPELSPIEIGPLTSTTYKLGKQPGLLSGTGVTVPQSVTVTCKWQAMTDDYHIVMRKQDSQDKKYVVLTADMVHSVFGGIQEAVSHVVDYYKDTW